MGLDAVGGLKLRQLAFTYEDESFYRRRYVIGREMTLNCITGMMILKEIPVVKNVNNT